MSGIMYPSQKDHVSLGVGIYDPFMKIFKINNLLPLFVYFQIKKIQSVRGKNYHFSHTKIFENG